MHPSPIRIAAAEDPGDMGFAKIPAYYDNPLEGAVYMERSLD